MADEVQGLMVLTEGDRFITMGRAGRGRVWRIDLTGEAVEDVDRTGATGEVRLLDADGALIGEMRRRG